MNHNSAPMFEDRLEALRWANRLAKLTGYVWAVRKYGHMWMLRETSKPLVYRRYVGGN